MPKEVKQYKEQLEGRTMLVKKATVIPLEAIVRGYITGIFEYNILQPSADRGHRIWVVRIQKVRNCSRNLSP